MLFFLCLAATSVYGPGTYAHYSSATNISDDVQVDHIWEVIPSPSERDGNAVFASVQFWFENGVGGHFGTQVWREGATDTLNRVIEKPTRRTVSCSPSGTTCFCKEFSVIKAKIYVYQCDQPVSLKELS